MIKDMTRLLRSGKVKRWHSNPDMNHSGENLAEHQWTVTQFVLFFKPDASRELLIAALHHDVGELVAGDLGFDFKKQAPQFAAKHAAIEGTARGEIVSGQQLTAEDMTILKLADWMAAWDAMCQHQPGLRKCDDWKDQIKLALGTAQSLSPADGARLFRVVTDRHAKLDLMNV